MAATALAQTTGRIDGRTMDSNGGPLPGVTIRSNGPRLQGERTAVSDLDGRFRLLALPPGDYTVTAELDGFNPLEVENVRVALDHTTTLALELAPGFGEEITVSGLAPVLDHSSTTTGAEFSQEVFADLPVVRAYHGLAFLAPGVTRSNGQLPRARRSPSIRGASGAANRYIVDGLDVTDVAFGTLSSDMAFEFVEEVEVKTGGYEAEYGGALGGVINVITKAGGNELHGDLFGYFSDDDLQASSPTTQDQGGFLGRTEYDFGLDFGGKLIQDELWYFVAVNPTVREERVANRQGIPYDLRSENALWAGKLTWRLDPSKQLVASAFGEERDGPLFVESLNSAGTVANNTDNSTRSVGLAYTSTLSPNLLLEVSVGRFEETFRFAALDESSPLYTDRSGTGFWAKQQNCGDPRTLNGNGIQFAQGCVGGASVGGFDPSREQARAAVSWFAGRHEVKAGIDYRSPSFDERIRFPAPSGGPLVDATGFVFAPQGVTGARFDLTPGSYTIIEQSQDSRGETEEVALFVQDQWRVTPHLTFDLGMRLDSLHATGDFPDRELDFGFGDMVAPRVGFTWDVTRDGRSKLYGHFGRFYEAVPLAVNTRNMGESRIGLYFLLYPEDGSLPTYDNLGTFLGSFAFGLGQSVDPDIDPMHTDEYVLGFEYAVRPNLAVGVAGVYRELRDVVEDVSLDGGNTLLLTNPGGTYRTDPATGMALPQPVIFPEPEREYRAVELTLNKRFTDGWQLFSSYVYSENEGNYEGLGDSAHFSSQFDLPHLLVGATGPLPNDRTHHFKSYGSYLWSFGLVTGFALEFVSGTPVSKLGFDEVLRSPSRFVTPRGSAGRTPDLQHLDVHLAYPIRIREDLRLELIADVFNATNEQRAVALDEIWTFARGPATLDPTECGGPGTGPGTACPMGNPRWGTARMFQQPRSVRFGIKLGWGGAPAQRRR